MIGRADLWLAAGAALAIHGALAMSWRGPQVAAGGGGVEAAEIALVSEEIAALVERWEAPPAPAPAAAPPEFASFDRSPEPDAPDEPPPPDAPPSPPEPLQLELPEAERVDAPLPQQEPPPPPKPKETARKDRPAAKPAPARAAPSVAGRRLQASRAVRASKLQLWRAAIRRDLFRSRRYPAASRRMRETGTAKLRLAIAADGRLLSVRLAKSTGHARLDQAALDAARRAAPFPEAPAELGGRRQTFLVSLVFQLR